MLTLRISLEIGLKHQLLKIDGCCTRKSSSYNEFPSVSFSSVLFCLNVISIVLIELHVYFCNSGNVYVLILILWVQISDALYI